MGREEKGAEKKFPQGPGGVYPPCSPRAAPPGGGGGGGGGRGWGGGKV